MHQTQCNIIRLRQVSVHYGQTVALEDITTDITCGKSTAIVGPNGAGKSTLLRTLLGWHPLKSGEIRIGDTHPRHALPRLAYLPQRHTIDWDFPITVHEVVAQGRYPSLGLFRKMNVSDLHKIDQALSELGLTSLAKRPLRALSGGQQQRVFLARALAQGADIFLLDEPFTGLDLCAAEELIHIIRLWTAQGRTVLASVHDLHVARESFQNALLIDQKLIAAGSADDVLSQNNIDLAFRKRRSVHTDPLHFARTIDFSP